MRRAQCILSKLSYVFSCNDDVEETALQVGVAATAAVDDVEETALQVGVAATAAVGSCCACNVAPEDTKPEGPKPEVTAAPADTTHL